MVWRPMTTPVVAACLMGLVIGLVILSKPAPRPRLSKTEKRVSTCYNSSGGLISRKHCITVYTVAAVL